MNEKVLKNRGKKLLKQGVPVFDAIVDLATQIRLNDRKITRIDAVKQAIKSLKIKNLSYEKLHWKVKTELLGRIP